MVNEPVWCETYPTAPGCALEQIPAWLQGTQKDHEWCDKDASFPGCKDLTSKVHRISNKRSSKPSSKKNLVELCRSFLLNPNIRHSPDVVFKCRSFKEELEKLPREERCKQYNEMGLNIPWAKNNCTDLTGPIEKAICSVAKKTGDVELVKRCNAILARKGLPLIVLDDEQPDISYDSNENIIAVNQRAKAPVAAIALPPPPKDDPPSSTLKNILFSLLVMALTFYIVKLRVGA